MTKLSVQLHNPRIFWRKVATVTIALLILEPLLYFQLYVPSLVYVGVLLALHIIFLSVYITGMPWREVLANKQALFVRIVGVVMAGYLLTLVKATDNLIVIFANLVAMAVLHAIILACIMVTAVSVEKA